MERSRALKIVSVLFLAAVLLLPASAGAQTTAPCSFFGTVKVDGANVADDTSITAWIEGVQVGNALTFIYNGDSVYLIDVVGDPGDFGGKQVNFKVAGLDAAEHGFWYAYTTSEVNLTATSAPELPTIAFSPASFAFSAVQGGANPADQVLSISNSAGGTLNWSVADDADWLGLSPASGSSTGETDQVALSVDIAGLGAGSHDATITISAAGATNTPQTVLVSLTVTSSETTICFAPASFTFITAQVGTNPADQVLEIWNCGGGTLDWSAADDAGWLSLSLSSGSSTGERDQVTLSVDVSGLAKGNYSATITITASGAINSPQIVPVSLLIETLEFNSSLNGGWNLLSTPIALGSGHNQLGQVVNTADFDLAYAYNTSSKEWEQVTSDSVLRPLEAVYIHALRASTASFVPSSDVTNPPLRELGQDWNLIGPAPQLQDGGFASMGITEALVSIAQTAEGLTGYVIVVSPALNQEGWVYTVETDVVPSLVPFKGYWVFMENADNLAGFSTTPVQ